MPALARQVIGVMEQGWGDSPARGKSLGMLVLVWGPPVSVGHGITAHDPAYDVKDQPGGILRAHDEHEGSMRSFLRAWVQIQDAPCRRRPLDLKPPLEVGCIEVERLADLALLRVEGDLCGTLRHHPVWIVGKPET
jgi:hypothetical protein